MTDIDISIEFVDNTKNNENINNEDDEEYDIGVKLFKTSNKPIKCTKFLHDIKNEEIIKSATNNRCKYLNNELTYTDKKRKRSNFITIQMENKTSINNSIKQILENEKKETLEQLKQSVVSYNDIISTQWKYSDKKSQIIYQPPNTEFIDKPCSTISTTQYEYIDIHLSKPLFDQIYQVEKGLYIKDENDQDNDQDDQDNNNNNNNNNDNDNKENEENEESVINKKDNDKNENVNNEIEIEKEEEEKEKEEKEEDNSEKVYLFPYYPSGKVYNIVDDSEGDFKPFSKFNHKYKYHNTNVTLYNIFKESHEPGTNNTIKDKNADIETPPQENKEMSNKKKKRKRFFKRG
ncbi:hypothetical protein ACTFIW_012956 [Dictyostelium discoideum]